MRQKTILKKLESLGVVEFRGNRPNQAITYYSNAEEGYIDVDFWNIASIIPCKYNHDYRDLVPFGVRILIKKDAKINANVHDHVFKDVSSVSKREFMDLADWLDLKKMINECQSIGLKIGA